MKRLSCLIFAVLVTLSITSFAQTFGGGVWNRLGAAVFPTLPQDQGYDVEASAMYEDGIGCELWYRQGFDEGVGGIGYSTSPNCLPGTWTRYNYGANVLGFPHPGWLLEGPHVVKVPGQSRPYFMFVTAGVLCTSIQPYGPFDSCSTVLSVGGAGAWDEGAIANPYVFQDAIDGSWNMYYEGCAARCTIWHVGLATAPSPSGPWTEYSGNPIINSPYQSSGPFGAQVGGTYWLWVHGCQSALYNSFAADICRFTSTDKHNWIQSPSTFTFWRTSPDEGANEPQGAVADPFMLPIYGNQHVCPNAPNYSCTFLFYDATQGEPTYGGGWGWRNQIKEALANMTISDIVATNEGIATEAPGLNTLDIIAQFLAISQQFTTGVGGVLINGLVSLAPDGTVVNYSGTGPILGLAESTQPAAVTVIVDLIGKSSCLPEGPITAGDYLIAGSATATSCKDSGQSDLANISRSTYVVGRAAESSTNAPLPTPGPPVSVTQHGLTGSSTRYYWCVCMDAFGVTLISPSPTPTTTGYAYLSPDNYNIVTCPTISGAAGYYALTTTDATPPTGIINALVSTGVSSIPVINDQSNFHLDTTVPILNTSWKAVAVTLLGPNLHGSM